MIIFGIYYITDHTTDKYISSWFFVYFMKCSRGMMNEWAIMYFCLSVGIWVRMCINKSEEIRKRLTLTLLTWENEVRKLDRRFRGSDTSSEGPSRGVLRCSPICASIDALLKNRRFLPTAWARLLLGWKRNIIWQNSPNFIYLFGIPSSCLTANWQLR